MDLLWQAHNWWLDEDEVNMETFNTFTLFKDCLILWGEIINLTIKKGAIIEILLYLFDFLNISQ